MEKLITNNYFIKSYVKFVNIYMPNIYLPIDCCLHAITSLLFLIGRIEWTSAKNNKKRNKKSKQSKN